MKLMYKYTFSLEENLSEDEVQRVLDAIFLLRGIKKIEKTEDEFTADIPYNPKTPPPHHAPPSPNFISPQLQPFAEQTNPNQINPTPENAAQINPTPENAAQINPTPENAASQRKIISEALRWGIHNKKITLEEIRDVSPQETVNIAQKIIETMPDEEKKKFLKF